MPLAIHVNPTHFIALNYTCRYCANCDLLIAHKHEVEHILTGLFTQSAPIGNDYLVLGTMEKKGWREGMKQQKSVGEAQAYLHDFKTCFQELRLRQAGWYPSDQEPPILEPPPSQEWVKSKQ